MMKLKQCLKYYWITRDNIMKNRDEKVRDFLDNTAMYILLIISIPFMLVVMGLSKLAELISKKK